MARSNRATNANRSARDGDGDGCKPSRAQSPPRSAKDCRDKDATHAIDLEVEIETEGDWMEVDIEIENLDLDLKLGACYLQPDTSPATNVLRVEDTSVGENTSVDADIVGHLIGSVTVAFETTKVTSAVGSDPGAIVPSEPTFADSCVADLIVVFNNTTSSSIEGETSYQTSLSATTYIAIDFEDFDFAEAQIELNFHDEVHIVTKAENAE